MVWEHQKSATTVLLDFLRWLLILGGTYYCLARLWDYSWPWALVAAVPVFVVVLNLVGFLTLPLYALTPENRSLKKGWRAAETGDVDRLTAATQEFEQRFKVKHPTNHKEPEG